MGRKSPKKSISSSLEDWRIGGLEDWPEGGLEESEECLFIRPRYKKRAVSSE